MATAARSQRRRMFHNHSAKSKMPCVSKSKRTCTMVTRRGVREINLQGVDTKLTEGPSWRHYSLSMTRPMALKRHVRVSRHQPDRELHKHDWDRASGLLQRCNRQAAYTKDRVRRECD